MRQMGTAQKSQRVQAQNASF